MGKGIWGDPRDELPHHLCLVIDPFDGEEHLAGDQTERGQRKGSTGTHKSGNLSGSWNRLQLGLTAMHFPCNNQSSCRPFKPSAIMHSVPIKSVNGMSLIQINC